MRMIRIIVVLAALGFLPCSVGCGKKAPPKAEAVPLSDQGHSLECPIPVFVSEFYV